MSLCKYEWKWKRSTVHRSSKTGLAFLIKQQYIAYNVSATTINNIMSILRLRWSARSLLFLFRKSTNSYRRNVHAPVFKQKKWWCLSVHERKQPYLTYVSILCWVRIFTRHQNCGLLFLRMTLTLHVSLAFSSCTSFLSCLPCPLGLGVFCPQQQDL